MFGGSCAFGLNLVRFGLPRVCSSVGAASMKWSHSSKPQLLSALLLSPPCPRWCFGFQHVLGREHRAEGEFATFRAFRPRSRFLANDENPPVSISQTIQSVTNYNWIGYRGRSLKHKVILSLHGRHVERFRKFAYPKALFDPKKNKFKKINEKQKQHIQKPGSETLRVLTPPIKTPCPLSTPLSFGGSASLSKLQ